MNKELTPLEALEKISKEIIEVPDLDDWRKEYIKKVYKKEFKTIEQALKEYENLKNNKSSRINYSSFIVEHSRELKTLEIIKKINESSLRHFIATYVEDDNERELVKEVLL